MCIYISYHSTRRVKKKKKKKLDQSGVLRCAVNQTTIKGVRASAILPTKQDLCLFFQL